MENTSNKSQGSYEPPPGASRIIPSGFMGTWNWLESMGYPKPPALMLELNGRLVRTFEDVFGWLHAWKGYKKFNISHGHGKNAWQRLDKKIVATISRRVISLVSFNGEGRSFFSCTGFLIRGPSRKGRTRNVIVTSASLVRTCDVTDKFDENMRIEVFLPPNQRLNGTLESYHSGYNIAIVTVKGLRNICPEDMKFNDLMHNSENPVPRRVVAIGREPKGVLCASMGEPILCDEDLHRPSTFGCEQLKLSNCKIVKVGIGGPLINYFNGSLVGMNFYDGRPDRTPYLPCKQIHEVLHSTWRLSDRSVLRLDEPAVNDQCRWHVPKPYWYHGLLEMNRFGPMPMRGRVLQ